MKYVYRISWIAIIIILGILSFFSWYQSQVITELLSRNNTLEKDVLDIVLNVGYDSEGAALEGGIAGLNDEVKKHAEQIAIITGLLEQMNRKIEIQEVIISENSQVNTQQHKTLNALMGGI